MERVPSEHCRDGLVLQWDREGASAMGLLTAELAEQRAATLVLRAGGETGVGDVAETVRSGDLVGCPALEPAPVRGRLRLSLIHI